MKKKIWFINAGTVSHKGEIYDYEDTEDCGPVISDRVMSIHVRLNDR